MEIKFGFDKVTSDGEKCEYCGVIVYEKIVPYLQIGEPEKVIYFKVVMCEPCYLKTDEDFNKD